MSSSTSSVETTANGEAADRQARCTLCDLPTPKPPVTGEAVEGTFCCTGCREVYRTLGDLDADSAAAVRNRIGGRNGRDETIPDHAEDTFFHVDGMHCTACEAFLETVAEHADGVYGAQASYTSDMVRVAYDPECCTEADLASLLTRGAYTASRDRPDPDATSDTTARLLVGGFFTMMVMVWYVIFLYPVYTGGDGLVPLTGEFARYALGNVWLATTVVIGVTGWPIVRGAGVSLRVLRPNMDLLLTLAVGSAYFYSAGTVLMGGTEAYFDVAVVIVFVVSLGRWIERRVKNRAAGLLATLTQEQVNTARQVGEEGSVETREVEMLEPGDVIRVREGERVPVDGTVAAGRASVDESLLTGEARPVTKQPGDNVIGGSVVQAHALEITVADDATSTVDRLIRLMWEIQASTPGPQQVADRLATVFVPLVLVLGLGAVLLQLGIGTPFPDAVLTGLTVLIVSCPCALGLATPLAVAAGTQSGVERRIVFTHAGTFEAIANLQQVVFDKTGTLTTGEMQVTRATGDDDALRLARAVEQWASHPVAEAITSSGPRADAPVTDVTTHPRGVEAEVSGADIFVGHPGTYRALAGTLPSDVSEKVKAARANAEVPVVVGWNGTVRGFFAVADTVRPEADQVLDQLRQKGVQIAVCTGDHDAAAAPLRADPRIDEVFAEVKPETKRALIQQWRAQTPSGTVAMVGDGSNDAPALADADLGIAFGPTALAADSADVVLLANDLNRLPDALRLARTTRSRIRQNLGWAFGYNAVAIPLAITGWLNPLAAALAMATSSLLVVVNSARGVNPKGH